jgi:hypothetical protein
MNRSSRLLEQAVETGDNAVAARLRSEACAASLIESAEAVAQALDVIERAAGQVSRSGSLRVFAERLGRAYARAMARLGQEERAAVRERLEGRA